MSLNIKPKTTLTRSLTPVALATALVLVTYVTPMATLPPTAAAIGAGDGARAWMLSSMSVGLAAALLVAGVLGDNYGRRRVLLLGLVALAFGALGCAFAWEPVLFVAARVVEGVGGAAVLACGLAVLAHDYPPGPARVHATSIWGASVALGISLGAASSAAFATHWRESYAIVAVAALVLLVPSVFRIGESRAESRRRLDTGGLVLLAATLTLIVSALTFGRSGVDLTTVVLAVAALVGGVAFAVVESRGRQPLLEPELLRHSRFRAATIGSFSLGVGIIGMTSFVPTVAQLGLHTGIWPACLLVIAWSGTSVVAAYLIRHLRHPLEGGLPIAGLLVVVAAGQLLALGLDADAGPWRLVAPMAVTGVATGMLNALLGREAVASVPPDRAAMGSGANNTARYLGAAVGITLFVVIATHTGAGLTDGWNTAVAVSAAATLFGAGAVALAGRSRANTVV